MRWIAVLAVLASTAHAGAFDVPDNSGPIPDPNLRFDGGLGLRFGWFEAGATGDASFGIESEVAARYDRWSLVGRASIDEIDRTDGDRYAPTDGFRVRLGGDVRATVLRGRALVWSKHGKPVQYVRVDLWFGAGLGHERVDWHRGAPTDRTDVALEIGVDDLVRVGATKAVHAMFSARFEIDIARPPDDRVDLVHSAHDHSGMFVLSAAFGH